jgi:hypothetical protein
MSIYDVQLLYEFSPGDVKGSTEEPPDDLLGDDGVLMKLAVWPLQPFGVEASGDADAVEQAERERARQGNVIFINDRVGKVRVEELTKRPRPGAEGQYTSVVAIWVAKRRGDDEWHMVSIGTAPTLATAES